MTSLSTLHGNTLCAYFHSEESNIPLFILNRRNRSPSSLHLDTTTAVTFRRTIISLSAAEDFDFDANKLRSERCPIFNFFFPPMNRGTLLDGLLGSAHHYRKKKKKFPDDALLCSPGVRRCSIYLAFQAEQKHFTRQSRSVARSAHVDNQFPGEYQMQLCIPTPRV